MHRKMPIRETTRKGRQAGYKGLARPQSKPLPRGKIEPLGMQILRRIAEWERHGGATTDNLIKTPDSGYGIRGSPKGLASSGVIKKELELLKANHYIFEQSRGKGSKGERTFHLFQKGEEAIGRRIKRPKFEPHFIRAKRTPKAKNK